MEYLQFSSEISSTIACRCSLLYCESRRYPCPENHDHVEQIPTKHTLMSALEEKEQPCLTLVCRAVTEGKHNQTVHHKWRPTFSLEKHLDIPQKTPRKKRQK